MIIQSIPTGTPKPTHLKNKSKAYHSICLTTTTNLKLRIPTTKYKILAISTVSPIKAPKFHSMTNTAANSETGARGMPDKNCANYSSTCEDKTCIIK